MIAIIDYGMGNIASVQKAFRFLNIETIVTHDHLQISKADGIVLPGVGSFKQGMDNLRNKDLINTLNNEVLINRKPFLGICLGMQLVMEWGTEPEDCEGLGWIKGKVNKIENKNFPIPHLGWNKIFQPGYNNDQEDLVKDNFYFIHSYHVVPEEDVIESYVHYEFEMVASIKKNNIYATQFHPEKSQDAGLSLIKSYFQRNA